MVLETNFSDSPPCVKAVPLARWIARREGLNLSLVNGSGPGNVILLKDIEKFMVSQKEVGTVTKTRKIRASSLARRWAEKKGVSLEAVEGTGTRNRIMMGDVIKASKQAIADEEKKIFGQTFPMSQIRKVIAKRMCQSAFTAPHISFFTDIDMGELSQLRDNILGSFEKQFKARVSINDFIIKAAALTLREFPMLNAMVKGEEIHIMPEINIGLAVALEEGLIVPAIPRADELGLEKIAQTRADLIERARTGKLRLEEIERGTFTISSLAQFDIVFFTAILNPPQSGILTIGKTRDQLVMKGGQIIIKRMARFGLSADHRVVDGTMAATFIESLKNKIETPRFAFTYL